MTAFCRATTTFKPPLPVRLRRWWTTALILCAVVLLCAFSLLPIAWAFASSLMPLEKVYTYPPAFSLDDPQWSNYGEAVTRLPVARFLVNSLVITLSSVVGAVITSSMAGFALARLRFRWRGALLICVLISMMIPAQVLLIPRFLLYDLLGWVGTYKPLIVPAWLGGGAFNVLLFRQFFRMIPQDYEDAARLDGATTWQTYRLILLPMVKPAIVAAAVLSFVYHWQEFLDPLIYLGDYSKYPISLGLRMYQTQAGTWANLLMAASLIALVPVAIMFFLCDRYVMRGLGVEQTVTRTT